jgi:predicted transposase/invertase (TIGR01784 family)
MLTGFEEAKSEGYDEGFDDGMEEGIRQCTIDITKNMLANNFDVVMIVKITGLSVEHIKSIQAEIN